MLEVLTIFLLTVHLLAMNLASAGPLLGVLLRWRHEEAGNRLGRRQVGWSTGAFIVGMLTGGLLILTIPGDSLWAALQRFPSRTYWFAGIELLFSLVCMSLIVGGWRWFNNWVILALALISATNLLYHFPPLMAVIGKLSANPNFASAEVIDRPVLLDLISRGEVAALSFHFGFASFAVSAIVLLYLIYRDDSEEEAKGNATVRQAAGVAFVATLMQIPVGVWLLISLPGISRMALMGKSLGGSLAFMAAMVLSLILLQRLFSAMLGGSERKNLRSIATLTCIVVLLMTASLRLSRFTPPRPGANTKTASSANDRGCEALQSESNAIYLVSGSFLASSSDPPGSFPCLISSP